MDIMEKAKDDYARKVIDDITFGEVVIMYNELFEACFETLDDSSIRKVAERLMKIADDVVEKEMKRGGNVGGKITIDHIRANKAVYFTTCISNMIKKRNP